MVSKRSDPERRERARQRWQYAEEPTQAVATERSPGVPLSLQHAVAKPLQAAPAGMLSLQRAAGNRAVSRHIQAKLVVGAANDLYEREADRIASRVLSMPTPTAPGARSQAIQRRAEEEDEAQTKPLAASITPLVQRQGEEEEEIQAKPMVQRVIIPFKQVHQDWNLADKQAALDGTLGFCPPMVNGTQCTSATATKGALVGPQVRVTDKGSGQYEAEVYSAPVNVAGWGMWLPKAGPWRHPGANKAMMTSYAGVRPKSTDGTITLEVSGIPNHKRLAKQIEAHEGVHAGDNKRIIDQTLGQWDAKIHKAQAEKLKFAGTTATEAKDAAYRYIGGTTDDIGTRLDQQWGQASDDYHATARGKTIVDNPILNEKRNRLTLVFHLTSLT